MESRSLALTTGQHYDVPASLYPWLSEWSWALEPQTDLIVRRDDGRRVVLYHQCLQRLSLEGPLLTVAPSAISKLFSSTSAWELLHREWTPFVEAAGQVLVIVPPPAEVLQLFLPVVLTAYFQWARAGRRWTYEMVDGEEGPTFAYLSIPWASDSPTDPKVWEVYPTLADWMSGELTGRPYHLDATLSEDYDDFLCLALDRTLQFLLDDRNPAVGGGAKALDLLYEATDMSAVINHLMATVGTYPTPRD